MDGTAVVSVPIREQTQVAEARRKAVQLATGVGLGETESAKLALVVTEAATNILRHGGGGEILLDARSSGGDGEVTVVALDSGPGMANIQDCLRDGVTTIGDSPGTGLGAIQRQSDHFDVYSKPGKGTVIICGIGTAGRQSPLELPGLVTPGLSIGVVCLPRIGEVVSGDGWSVRVTDRGATLLLMCDGLGHGLGAADAADAAKVGFRQSKALTPEPLMDDLHRALRGTRGAAVAVVRIDPEERRLRFAGVGNIAGFFRWRDGQTRTVSQNGVVGHNMSKPKEYEYVYGGDLLAVFHSDGLSTKWDIDSYPGLATRHPMMIAAVLYRDFKRVRDDNLIVVLKTSAS
jgi:anti-sigma regulatory factor (Ser/Thr protein kinase)